MDLKLRKWMSEMAEFRLRDPQPLPDIAICSECGWRGPSSECETEEDGDWETGYYDVHVCPKCEDGGCTDNYDMSPEQLKNRTAWDKREEARKK